MFITLRIMPLLFGFMVAFGIGLFVGVIMSAIIFFKKRKEDNHD